ncbi:hypothetical protein [Rheinheimera hassiensis]|uniref:hypothetical protein n=1 Tax=Rheinheimera hassiensis TaxID=1193627 RepID=UPI001F051BFB|nr:hypothetical protein [Rheinheimera hassiensis]
MNSVKSKNITLSKVKHSKCVWTNGARSYNDNEKLFSYVKKSDNLFFSEIDVDDDLTTIAYCDYYGSFGIGPNFGSGRSATIESCLVKGIGRTPLSGVTESVYNSSGIYPLYEGITEVISYIILNKILPVGCIEHTALIYIGRSPFYSTSSNENVISDGYQDLALLVRHPVIRVGHFVRARNAAPQEGVEYSIYDDLERLKENIGGLNQCHSFHDVFTLFSENCANQFSFSRVNRIGHGALNHSNIAIDGKWLDLSNSTAVPDNHNGHAGYGDVPFLDEVGIVEELLKEWVYNFGKFTFQKISIDYYLDLYRSRYKEYFIKHCLEYFGLSFSDGCHLDPNVELFCAKYNVFIMNPTKVIIGVPREQYDIGKQRKYLRFIFGMALSEGNPIYKLYLDEFNSNYINKLEYRSFCMLSSIRSLKSVYLRPMLYIGNIYLYARSIVGCHDNLQRIIDETSEVGDWFLSKNIVFKNVSTELIFDGYNFKLLYNDEEVVFEDAKSLIRYMEKNSSVDFKFIGKDFKVNVIDVLSELVFIFK